MKDLKQVKKIYQSRPQSVGGGFVGKNALSARRQSDPRTCSSTRTLRDEYAN